MEGPELMSWVMCHMLYCVYSVLVCTHMRLELGRMTHCVVNSCEFISMQQSILCTTANVKFFLHLSTRFLINKNPDPTVPSSEAEKEEKVYVPPKSVQYTVAIDDPTSDGFLL